ncbi:MAG TPA: outer membrane beta-barrel protein [Marinobacter sp.]|nr:outer membrane beta-barrel protein [Marinobacter sp.]
MNNVVRTSLLATLITATLITSQTVCAEDKDREDMHYIGLLVTTLNHRSIGDLSKEAAWGNVGTLVLGGHISDLFHAELRAGSGFKDAKVPKGDLTLAVDYFASWYIGVHYPVTDYANIYGQFGFSYIDGEAKLKNPDASYNRQFKDLVGDYPDSAFSMSWLAGLDFEILSNTYLVFEGGRLFKDTNSEANTFQFSSGLRYEF